MTFVLLRTQFGRYVFAAGDNPEAARLSGINVNLVRTITFGISGFTAAIAGVVSASKFLRAQSDSGSGLELISIAAVVVGGTSIMGGEGAVWRTFLGVMLLRLIENGFNLVQVENYYRSIFQGLIILFAVALDALRHRRSRVEGGALKKSVGAFVDIRMYGDMKSGCTLQKKSFELA